MLMRKETAAAITTVEFDEVHTTAEIIRVEKKTGYKTYKYPVIKKCATSLIGYMHQLEAQGFEVVK